MPVALITGAGGGIAHAIARGLAADGFALALGIRGGKEGPAGVTYTKFPCDVTEAAEVDGLVQSVLDHYGRIDVVVHTAGPFNAAAGDTVRLPASQWRRYIDGNLSSLYWLCRAAVPAMRRQGWGRIIAFGCDQAAAAPGWAGHGAYAAAKAGVISLIRTLAVEEARYGITCNAICPGDIRRGAKELEPGDPAAAGVAAAPAGRAVVGGDVAQVVRFLCRPESAMLTGTVIPVNGGYPAWAVSMAGWLRQQGLAYD